MDFSPARSRWVRALLLRSWLDTRSAGPTAAALDEAFSLLYGAAIGLAVGTAFVAFAARSSSGIVTGLLSGLLGYVVVLVPALIASGPGDVSASEWISTVVFVAS